MNKSEEPILGILGGMGPYATIDFIRNIHDLTPNIFVDSDHIRIITDSNVKIPSRTRAILYNEDSPEEGMVESINNLKKMGASVIAVPCNSAHYFYSLVNPKCNGSWVNMLECVSNAVFKNSFESPLILGGYVTVSKKIYSNTIPKAQYLDNEDNQVIYDLIEDLKICTNNYKEKISKLIKLFKKSDADSILLACTELTAVAESFAENGIHVIDSNKEYALSLVQLIKQT